MAETRTYAAEARSTDTFGSVLASAREPPPGCRCTGVERLSGGGGDARGAVRGRRGRLRVELLTVIARSEGIPLVESHVAIQGEVDPNTPVRSDVTVFNRIELAVELGGVTEQADLLAERFKAR
jgi:hypothetical protein